MSEQEEFNEITVEARIEEGDLIIHSTLGEVSLTLRSPQPLRDQAEFIEEIIYYFPDGVRDVLAAAAASLEAEA